VATMNDETQYPPISDAYGQAARFADYGPGAHITYRDDGDRDLLHSGEVLEALPPAADKGLPLRYVVARDGLPNSFPDLVYQGDIVI
jgi:hypothetical protein